MLEGPEVVFLEVADAAEELFLGPGEAAVFDLGGEQFECADHVGSLEDPVVRRAYTAHLGFEERVEHGVDEVGDLFLAFGLEGVWACRPELRGVLRP